MERRWKVLLLVSVGSFMAFLDAPVVSVAFPAIKDSFSSTPSTTLAWVLDAYFIAFAALLIVAGKLADRFGRKLVFIGGMATFSAASLLCAIAPSADVLIAARTVEALGAAMAVPAGQGLMLSEFPANERKVAIGALGAIVGLAVALAPTVGGVVVDGLDWRWIFFGSTVVGAATIPWALSLLERNEPEHGKPLPDAIGALLQAAMLALLVLAILKRSEWGTLNVRTVSAFAVAIVAFVLFLHRCRRHVSPIVDLGLFRDRNFSAANLSSLIFGAAFYGTTINVVLFLTLVWHFSVLQTGLTFLPTGIFGAFFGRPAGTMAEKYGSLPIASCGSMLAGVGLLIIYLSVGTHSHYLEDWFAGSMVYSAGIVIGLTGLVGGAVTAAPPEKYALASGINAALRQVGGAIGVAVAVTISATANAHHIFGDTTKAFLLAACALFLAGAIAIAMRARLAMLGARESPEVAAGQVGPEGVTSPPAR